MAREKLKRANLEKAKKTPLSITVPEEISVGELASRLKVTAGELVKRLMMMGVMAGVNDMVDYDTAYLIADELGAAITKEVTVTIEDKLFTEDAEVDAIAETLGISVEKFLADHTRITPDRQHLSLCEKENGECEYLSTDSNGLPCCLIERAKPRQCREFPEKWNFPGWQSKCAGTFGDE